MKHQVRTFSRFVVLFSVLVILVACGDDNIAGPDPIDLTGTWRVSYTNLSGSGVSCFTSPIDYVITQIGTTFTGISSSTWDFTCIEAGETVVAPVTGAIITNGQISGTTITFDLATSAAQQTGTVSGNSISGTATWTIDVGALTVVLNGQFGGARL